MDRSLPVCTSIIVFGSLNRLKINSRRKRQDFKLLEAVFLPQRKENEEERLAARAKAEADEQSLKQRDAFVDVLARSDCQSF